MKRLIDYFFVTPTCRCHTHVQMPHPHADVTLTCIKGMQYRNHPRNNRALFTVHPLYKNMPKRDTLNSLFTSAGQTRERQLCPAHQIQLSWWLSSSWCSRCPELPCVRSATGSCSSRYHGQSTFQCWIQPLHWIKFSLLHDGADL